MLISKMGLQLALLVINTVAIDVKNFGIAHSASYDRIIKVFKSVNKNDDDSFCFLAASLMFECDLLGLHVTHNHVYDNFKEVVDEYRNLLMTSGL